MLTPEAQEKVNAVKRLVKQGKKVSDACQEAKVPRSYYYALMRKLGQTTLRKPYTRRLKVSNLEDLAPLVPPSKLLVLIGSPQEILEFIRRY
jgi:hypothetical protein